MARTVFVLPHVGRSWAIMNENELNPKADAKDGEQVIQPMDVD